jgi:hypothetical protein
MKNLKSSLFFIAIALVAASCSSDDNHTTSAVDTKTVSNLHAPVTSNPGEPPAGDFVKFSFATGEVVTSGEDWDIAFRATAILVNGGTAATDQPERTGLGAASVVTGTFAGVITAPDDSLFAQDATTTAIPTGSGNGWYSYNADTHVISPIAGRVIVVKTHDGKYAKMEILNYYQDAPAMPTGLEPSAYYKFNYSYQPNGTKIFE